MGDSVFKLRDTTFEAVDLQYCEWILCIKSLRWFVELLDLLMSSRGWMASNQHSVGNNVPISELRRPSIGHLTSCTTGCRHLHKLQSELDRGTQQLLFRLSRWIDDKKPAQWRLWPLFTGWRAWPELYNPICTQIRSGSFLAFNDRMIPLANLLWFFLSISLHVHIQSHFS